MTIPRQVLYGYGLFYSYCVIIDNDVHNPVDEYFYHSEKWENGLKRVLSSREDLPGIKQF